MAAIPFSRECEPGFTDTCLRNLKNQVMHVNSAVTFFTEILETDDSFEFAEEKVAELDLLSDIQCELHAKYLPHILNYKKFTFFNTKNH